MRPALIAVVALFVFACGKSSDKPAGAGGGGPIQAFCERTMAAANPNQCWGHDAQAKRIKNSLCVEILGGAKANGRIDIDSDALAACEKAALAGLATLDNHRNVSDLAEAFPECRTVTTGKQAVGDDCLGTMECQPGLVCSGMHCLTPRNAGDKCRIVLELTMAVRHSDCADGLYCDMGDSICKASMAKGGACVLSRDCADGLRCRGKLCIEAAPSKAGEECDDHAECPAGHYCRLGGGPCEPLKPDGESCLTDGECLHQCVSKPDSVSGSCGPC